MQSDVEKIILHALASGVSPAGPLGAIFSPHLDSLLSDSELLTVLRHNITLSEPFFPPAANLVPLLTASNNWAVHANFSLSGSAMQSSDPHLVMSQLPASFSEVVFQDTNPNEPDSLVVGVTVPGLPSIVMGRTKFVSFGMT